MSQRKLLLADDSITIQKVVNLTFADEGIEVITVGDGDSAMAKIVELAPDLVMADVNMPGLSGYQVCEKIRQSETLKHIPVILLVGSFEPFDEEEAKRVDANDFLTKPFQSIRQLVNKVTDLLNNNNGSSNGSPGAAVSTNGAQPATAPAAENQADFYSHAPVNNFEQVPESDYQTPAAKTVEYQMPSSPLSSGRSLNDSFGDAGMDDEMIQTNQPPSFPLDESAKFESHAPVVNYDESFETIDYAKTQPLTAEDIEHLSFAELPPIEVVAEPTDSEDSADYNQPIVASPFGQSSDESHQAESTYHSNATSAYEEDYFSVEPDVSEEAPAVAENQAAEESRPVFIDASTRREITPPSEMFFDSDDDMLEVPYDEEDEEEEDEDEEEENIAVAPAEDEAETVEPETAAQPQEAPYQDEAPIEALPAQTEASEQLSEAAQPGSEFEQPAAEPIETPSSETLNAVQQDYQTAENAVQPEQSQIAETSAAATPPATAAAAFSPELIEAIAQRVVEKLSDRAVREIAWEVVPDLADLIVKQMAEDKFKT